MGGRSVKSARLLVQGVFGVLGAATVAGAQEVEHYLVEYRAYDAALRSGDGASAIRHARAAWDAAEQALGDHRLTAILAYNYGRLLLFTDAAKANAALQRSRELLAAGIADLTPEHVNAYADYAQFVADGTKRRHADRLRETLTAIGLDDPGIMSDLAPMWLRLASHDALEERYRKARDSAAMAEVAIRQAAPDATQALAEAIVLRGIARLVPYPREVEDLQAAHNEFVRALALFEPQQDLDSFDPLFAQILAWDHATGSALQAMGRDDYPDHEEDPAKEDAEDRHIFAHWADPSITCGDIEWTARDAPRYPMSALRRGYIGAVLIGFRLGEDLRVHDARVLAEVPQEEFGEEALRSMEDWRASALPAGDPACLQNLTTAFRFVIED